MERAGFKNIMCRMQKISKKALLLFALVLGGCSLVSSSPGSVPPLAGIEIFSVIGTDKTLTDHLVSFSTGKNCSTIRRNLGQTYCEEDEITVPEEIYCYRTLGKVNCYAEPNPFDNRVKAVGHIPAGATQTR